MGATALINHSRALSTSKMGLNFGRDAGSTWAFGPGWWHQPGLKGGIGTGLWHQPGQWPPLVPVGATNQEQRPVFGSPKGGKRRPLVPVGGTNRD